MIEIRKQYVRELEESIKNIEVEVVKLKKIVEKLQTKP